MDVTLKDNGQLIKTKKKNLNAIWAVKLEKKNVKMHI